MKKYSFSPVANDQTRVLILGSLPGDASLAKQQYYGHPRNHFWKLIGEVISVDLIALPYPEKLEALLAHHVGLWDVIQSAQRAGSLDSDIRDPVAHPLADFINSLPCLQLVAFNGGTAERLGRKVLAEMAGDRVEIWQLPSSSPAHTMAFMEKYAKWQQLRHYLA